MKVIDLLNKIENGENVPKKIRVDREIYEWDILEHFYKKYNGDDLLELCTEYNTGELLNMNVELIEDNTIDIDSIEELNNRSNGYFGMLSEEAKVSWLNKYQQEDKTKINELIQAVKQLNKEIKDLKEEIK